MEREQYEAIQPGDEIVRMGSNSLGWTQGKVYKVLDWALGMLRVPDDDGDERPVGRMDFSGGNWALVNSAEVVKPGKAYEELAVGDVLKYMPDGEAHPRLTKGKDYVVFEKSQSGLALIRNDSGDKLGIGPAGYGEGKWLLQTGSRPSECMNILPEDYLSLVDLALETRDKEWYNELMKKAKEPV